MTTKPLGYKSYGSIPHLPNSRIGQGDHKCHVGQAEIATLKTRDKYDLVIVQEKLDGSNVGVAKIDDKIIPLGRNGYPAQSSPYEQHQVFADWVRRNELRFADTLENGERICGEWLMQAHGTRYVLWHEPFVAFDIMRGAIRLPFDEFIIRASAFQFPHLLHRGNSISVDAVVRLLGEFGFHGALDPVEGAVWRVERNELNGKVRTQVVDFLVKWVRPDKVDGKYLPELSGDKPIWNWEP